MILRFQKYYGLFPGCRPAESGASATILASLVGGPDFADLYAVYPLYRIFYLGLIGPSVHLKRVGTSRIRKVHTLLGNQRPNYDVIVVHINTR